MSELNLREARAILSNLETVLQVMSAKDPEQEVRGIAIPALDTALSAIRGLIPDSSVTAGINDIISPMTVAEGEPIRAVDALVVVSILIGAIPPPAPRRPSTY
jgi:hypothetical protein